MYEAGATVREIASDLQVGNGIDSSFSLVPKTYPISPCLRRWKRGSALRRESLFHILMILAHG
jgi:hypothetical protein